MPLLELPHWLMIAGILLVLAGLIGMGFSRNKQVESEPTVLPGDLASWKHHGSVSSDEIAHEPKRPSQI
jgi:hypothetical protein